MRSSFIQGCADRWRRRTSRPSISTNLQDSLSCSERNLACIWKFDYFSTCNLFSYLILYFIVNSFLSLLVMLNIMLSTSTEGISYTLPSSEWISYIPRRIGDNSRIYIYFPLYFVIVLFPMFVLQAKQSSDIVVDRRCLKYDG